MFSKPSLLSTKVQPFRRGNVMEYLVFSVNHEFFGIPVLLVQELSRLYDIYPVPGHDIRIAGLVNLRGNAVTVIDLFHSLFPGQNQNRTAQRQKLITLESSGTLSAQALQYSLHTFADPLLLLVDNLHRVITLHDNVIEPPPAHLHDSFVDGVIKDNEQLITMLSIEKLIDSIYTGNGEPNGVP